MLRGALGLGAISFMIVTLIGLYGAVDAGYDVVNHFRILFTLPALLLAVLAFVAKARAAAAITLAALLVHAFAIVPEVYAGWSSPAVESRPNRFKLVTFNVAFRLTDAQKLRRFIEAERPDVLVMQEVLGKGVATVDALKDLMPYRSHCMNEQVCDLALLSRHPIVAGDIKRATLVGPNPNRTRLVRADLDIGDLTGKPGRTVTVLTTHLAWPLPQERQQTQFRQLAKLVSALDTVNTILAGDFNYTPWSFALKHFDAAIPLTRVTRSFHSWPTRQTIAGISMPFPLLPIDHVFAGSRFRAESVRRGPYLGSDHYPVIVEFSIED
ncbi:MAG TPA: endonuclease/exonuclease/phosphatase family protein [Afifellaceae bacterium]|nr:endonuclease/exonuclease/phosphatase family protein [Afifellaceae bacterium]